jgi:alcohol dehydrogenase YqhD (iron-dependent ADH family)
MEPQKAAALGIDKFEEWLRSVNMYLKLSDVGIGSDRFETMAADTVRIYGNGNDYIANARKLYREDIVRIYEMAL